MQAVNFDAVPRQNDVFCSVFSTDLTSSRQYVSLTRQSEALPAALTLSKSASLWTQTLGGVLLFRARKNGALLVNNPRLMQKLGAMIAFTFRLCLIKIAPPA